MPQLLRKWVTMLETLLAKHRYMKWVFARSRDRDHLDAFLDGLTSSVGRMEAILEDAAQRPSLCDVLDRVLNKGAVIDGEATISVAGIDLVYLD